MAPGLQVDQHVYNKKRCYLWVRLLDDTKVPFRVHEQHCSVFDVNLENFNTRNKTRLLGFSDAFIASTYVLRIDINLNNFIHFIYKIH